MTGLILTKIDGDARGGAALSIAPSPGSPVKFLGTGEKTDALEVFHPDRLAGRILGMGDVLTLVERAQETFDASRPRKLEEKLRKAEFTLEDFLDQLQQVQKMGPIGQLMGDDPGHGRHGQGGPGRRRPRRPQAGRGDHPVDDAARAARPERPQRRPAGGGSPPAPGTSLPEVNRLVKQFARDAEADEAAPGRPRTRHAGGMPIGTPMRGT